MRIGLVVPDMSCSHCAERIRRALEQIGIQAEVDLQNKTVILDAKDVEVARKKLEQIDTPVKNTFEV